MSLLFLGHLFVAHLFPPLLFLGFALGFFVSKHPSGVRFASGFL